MKIRAIIFDFNGVLVRDEPIHHWAFEKVLKEKGFDLSWQEYSDRYLPYGDRDFFYHFLADHGMDAAGSDLDDLIAAKSRAYFAAIENEVPVIDATLDFIRRLPRGFPLAIASAAAGNEIHHILRGLDLAESFSVIVAAEDVVQGKPNPESFKSAFAGLAKHFDGLAGEQVLVVEDSEHGVEAAHRAGLRCLGLATTHPPERLQAADLIVPTLEGWSLERLQEDIR